MNVLKDILMEALLFVAIAGFGLLALIGLGRIFL